MGTGQALYLLVQFNLVQFNGCWNLGRKSRFAMRKVKLLVCEGLYIIIGTSTIGLPSGSRGRVPD